MNTFASSRLRRSHAASIVAACALALCAGIARAQFTTTWTGSAASGDWSTAGNWNGGAPTTSGTWALTFGNTTQTSSTNTIGGTSSTITLSSLLFTNGTNMTLNRLDSRTLTLVNNATVTMIGTASQNTINIPIALLGSSTFSTNSGGRTLLLNGAVSGTGSVTVTGGYVLLGTANSFSGGFTITGGGVGIGNDGAFASNTLTIAGGVLDARYAPRTISNSGTITNDFTFGGSNPLILSGSFDLNGGTRIITANGSPNAGTMSGVISNGGITKAGLAPLVLSGANTYSGVTTINSGTLQIGSGGASGALNTASTITGSSGATLAFNRTNTVTQGTDFNSVIGGSIGVAQVGSGTLVLGGVNTYSGRTSIQNGTLSVATINNASASGNLGTNATIDLGGSATTGALLYTGAGETTDRVVNLAGTTGGGVLDQSGSGSLRFSADITTTGAGPKSLTLRGSGAGTGELSGRLTDGVTGTTTLTSQFVTGATTITLDSVSGISVGAAISGANIAASTTVTAINAATRVITLSQATTTGTTAAGSLITVAGVTNPNALTKAGTGTWTLSGSNSYSGTTSINAGTLQIGSGSTAGSLSTSSVITGSAGATLAFNRSDTITQGTDFNSVIGGAINVSQLGSGVLTLSGTNTYTGATTVTLGTLRAGAAAGGQAFGNLSAVSLANTAGVTLDLNGFNQTIGSLAGGGASGGAVTLGAGTLTTGGDNKSTGFAGIISGMGGLTKSGTGMLTLSGTNNYSGATTINAGTLLFASTSALFGGTSANWTAANLTTGSGATAAFAVYGSSGFTAANLDTLRGLGTASTGFLPGSSIGIDTTGTAFTYSSNISDPNGGVNALGLAKLGSGTLTLTGSNTFTGRTTVAAGTLQVGSGGVAGSLASSSPISITSGATLAFNRSDAYGGNVSNTISGAGGLALSSGTLTLSGSNSYSGGTQVTAGVLRMGSAQAFGSSNAAVTVASGAALDVAGITGTNSNPYALTLNGSGISGGGALTNSGAAATFYGPVTLGSDSTIFANANNITLYANTGGTGITGNFALTVGGAFISRQVQVYGNIQTASVTVTNATLRLESNNSFAGGLTINSGVAIAKATGAFGTGTVTLGDTTGSASAWLSLGLDGTYTNPIVVRAGNTGVVTLDNYANYTVTAAGGITLNKGLTLNSGNAGKSLTVSGPISGVGGLTIQSSGTSTVALSGSNMFSGTTTMSASNPATLQVGSVWALQNSTLDTGSAGNQSVAFTATGTNTYYLGGLQGSDDLAIGANTLAIGGNGSATTFAGSISGVGGNLTKTGAAQLTLSGSNTYTGATTINAGTLAFDRIAALATTSGIGIASGAGLTYTGTTAALDRSITVTGGTGTVRNAAGGTLTLGGTLTKDGTVLRLTGGRFNVTGQIVGSSSNSDLLVDGTSTVTLSAVNTYNGPTFVNQASNLIVGVDNAIPNASVVTLGNAMTTGTLTLGSNSDSIGGLAFGAGGGTLRMAASAAGATAQLTSASGTMNLSGGTLDLTGSGTSAGLYRLLSAQSITGAFSGTTGLSPAYQLLATGSTMDLQQRAVLGTVSVTNPSVSIITGGSAAFTYTVANNALSGGAGLTFTGAGLSNVVGSSLGSVNAADTSGAIAGLVFTGTSIGSVQQGTFTVNDPSAFGATSATGIVSVNVLNHSLASFQASDTAALSLDLGTYDTASGWTSGSGSLGFSIWNIASGGFTTADTAGLALYDIVFTSGNDVFSTGLTNFANLASGTYNGSTASVLAPGSLAEGIYQGVYTLRFRDQQNLSGAADTRNLTLTANVIVVPEPGAVVLAGIGIGLAGWLLRRTGR